MVILIGMLMFCVGLLVGIIVFMKDESWEIQRKKLLEFIYFQLILVMRQKKVAKDELYRSRYEGEIIALEKVRDYITEMPLDDE